MGDVFDSILVQTAQILAKGVSGSANQMGIRSQVLTVIGSIKCRQLNLKRKREYKTDTRAAIGESTVYARPWTGPEGQTLSELYWLRIEGVVYDITSVVVELDLIGEPHHLTITIEEIVGSIPTVVTAEEEDMQSAITLTASQLLALNTTPVVLLAGQSGKALVPTKVSMQYKFGTIGYQNVAGILAMYWAGQTPDGSTDLFDLIGTNFLDIAGGNTLGAFTYSPTGLLLPGTGFGPSNPKTVLPSSVRNKALMLGLVNGSFAGGSVLTYSSTPSSAGSGYAVGDTGFLTPGGGELDCGYQIDSVDGGGGVLTFHLANIGIDTDASGDHYLTGVKDTNNYGNQPGVGSGFQVNVTSVGPKGNGSLVVTVDYTIVTLA